MRGASTYYRIWCCAFLVLLAARLATGQRAGAAARGDLQVRVIDAGTQKALANTDVDVYSDNGIRCIQAPCPTNGMSWRGRTDKHGVVVIPDSVVQYSMTIGAPGYRAVGITRSKFRRRQTVALERDVVERTSCAGDRGRVAEFTLSGAS